MSSTESLRLADSSFFVANTHCVFADLKTWG